MQINRQKKKILVIKNKRQFPFYLLIGILVLVASFLIGGLLYEAGVHTQFKLIIQGRVDELPDGSIKDTLQELYGMIKSETVAYTGNNLATLYLDIPFENVQIIQQKRDEARLSGILLSSDEDFVTATARYNDSAPMDVELRLKGDWTDHLEGEQWSYRIHIQDDAAIEGMRRFSIQAPETREFVYEWAYHQNLMEEGILAPRYFFINVIENGENKGIYALEESFYTDLMESQKRRSGVIIRFDEDDMWQNMAEFFEGSNEDLRTASQRSGYFMVSDYTAANVSAFGFGGIQKSEVLTTEYKTAQELLRAYQNGEMKASDVFDLEQIGKYLAITELWGAEHGLAWHNLRFYYNPVTNLLEPIGFDGAPMLEPFRSANFRVVDEINYLMMNQDIREAFYIEIQYYLDDEYIESLQDQFGQEAQFYADAMNKYYSFDTSLNWESLSVQRDYLLDQLSMDKYIEITNIAQTGDTYVFTIRNTFFTTLNLEVVEFRDPSNHILAVVTLNEAISPNLPTDVNSSGKRIVVNMPADNISGEELNINLRLSNPVDGNVLWIAVEE